MAEKRYTASDAFYHLITLCQNYKIGMELEYDTGMYIPGEFLDLNNIGKEPLPEHIRQGPSGWKITVGGYGLTNKDTGEELLCAAVGQTLVNGIGIAEQIIKERGENGSKA
jgi:hypothetical protein